MKTKSRNVEEKPFTWFRGYQGREVVHYFGDVKSYAVGLMLILRQMPKDGIAVDLADPL